MDVLFFFRFLSSCLIFFCMFACRWVFDLDWCLLGCLFWHALLRVEKKDRCLQVAYRASLNWNETKHKGDQHGCRGQKPKSYNTCFWGWLSLLCDTAARVIGGKCVRRCLAISRRNWPFVKEPSPVGQNQVLMSKCQALLGKTKS